MYFIEHITKWRGLMFFYCSEGFNVFFYCSEEFNVFYCSEGFNVFLIAVKGLMFFCSEGV